MLFECQVSKRREGAGWILSGRFRVASDEVLNLLGRPMVGLYARLMFQMDLMQRTPLPDGPKIVVPNHPSTTDPFLVTTLTPDPMSILIDDRLFKVPGFGGYLHQAGHVPVVPGSGREAFEAARRLLEEGRTVGIFIEGAISPLEGGFHAPRTGAARLALISGAPVIPVGIGLQRERIRLVETQIEGQAAVGTWYLRGPYAITVGEPMHFEGDVEDRAYVRTVSERIMQDVTGLAYESERRVEAVLRERAPAALRERALAAVAVRTEQATEAGRQWLHGVNRWLSEAV
jgi:1-acyl-sn-glycerol-3-phosphate acyltransferase